VRPSRRQTAIRAAGIALFLLTALLLTSVGGLGIVAAPVTLPLMYLVVRSNPTPPFRVAGGLIGGLTAAELAWGLVYLAAGEVPVVIWLAPVTLGLATASTFALAGRPTSPPVSPSPAPPDGRRRSRNGERPRG
jgi:hypothetical protein